MYLVSCVPIVQATLRSPTPLGTGVADDKAVYTYVPQMIEYYLTESPILPNIPTYLCGKRSELKYVTEHLSDLVVKAVNESGGYGMLMGPFSTKAQQAEFKQKLVANPRDLYRPAHREPLSSPMCHSKR